MPLRPPGSCLPLSFCIPIGTIHIGQENPPKPSELISKQNACCHIRKYSHRSEDKDVDLTGDSHSSCHTWVFRELEELYLANSKYSIAARDVCICPEVPE